MVNSTLVVKIGILIGIEILLITGSFAYIASFESENVLIGNSINIAGKNRFLTATVLLQSEYYLNGFSEKSEVEKSLNNLETNILLLRDGGHADTIEVGPLPSDFIEEWQTVNENWLIFRNAVEHHILSSSAVNGAAAQTELEELGNRLIGSSNTLVIELGEYVKASSQRQLTMQVGLGILNIAVHLLMIYLITRILKPIKLLTKATDRIREGNFDTFVLEKGSNELRMLARSFNSMVKSINQSSKQLAAEKKKYQELYDGAPDLYRSTSPDGIVLNCNRAYVEKLGYKSRDEVLGHSIFEHTAEQSLVDLRKSMDEWKNTGEVIEKEIWMKRNDGTVFPAALSATSMYDDNQVLIASNTVIIDETERYSTRKTLEQANDELKKLDSMKSEFVNTAAHELRSPILPIILNTELLSEEYPNDNRIGSLLRNVKRLNKLVSNILDESRLATKTFKLVKEETDILASLKELIQDFAKSIPSDKEVKAVFDNNLPAGLEAMNIFADKTRIEQVLMNLLDNALKFTDRGVITMSLEKIKSTESIRITVSDTGTGIDASVRDKLFQKFVTKSDTVKGTGLGLYLCKAIVDAHGGSITGFNNARGGASFVVTLPIGMPEIKSSSMNNN